MGEVSRHIFMRSVMTSVKHINIRRASVVIIDDVEVHAVVDVVRLTAFKLEIRQSTTENNRQSALAAAA
jgi:hypothetical protein